MLNVSLINFDYHKNNDGDLSVFESRNHNVPFQILRVFNVRANKGSIRGRHAHKECSQLLICSNGEIEVLCYNGVESEKFLLSQPNIGLLIKPGIWAEQKYLCKNSTLTVLCDRFFDENDYLRDKITFLNYLGL